MADKTTTLKTKTNDNVYPNVIGDNRDKAISDSPQIKHTLTADHKINFRLDTNVNNLINNSLQKPAGLTKTKLVGVGANGQENIEIGDNLTLANGKLSATGGGSGESIPVIEGTANQETREITIPEAQTKNFIIHLPELGYFYVNIFSGFYSSITSGSSFDPKNTIILSGRDRTLKIISNGNLVARYNINNENNIPDIIDKVFIAIYNNEPLLFTEIETKVYSTPLYIDKNNDSLYYYIIEQNKLTKKSYSLPISPVE